MPLPSVTVPTCRLHTTQPPIHCGCFLALRHSRNVVLGFVALRYVEVSGCTLVEGSHEGCEYVADASMPWIVHAFPSCEYTLPADTRYYNHTTAVQNSRVAGWPLRRQMGGFARTPLPQSFRRASGINENRFQPPGQVCRRAPSGRSQTPAAVASRWATLRASSAST